MFNRPPKYSFLNPWMLHHACPSNLGGLRIICNDNTYCDVYGKNQMWIFAEEGWKNNIHEATFQSLVHATVES